MLNVGETFNPYCMFNGVFIPDAIYSYKSISSTAKLLYARLCKYKGESGEAFPSVATLAEELGMHVRQVFCILKTLEEEKFIRRKPRPGTSSIYEFLWHKCFEEKKPRKTAGVTPAENRRSSHAETSTLRESYEENHLKPPKVPQQVPQQQPLNPEESSNIGPESHLLIEKLARDTAIKLLTVHPNRKCTPSIAAKKLVQIVRRLQVPFLEIQDYFGEIVRRHSGWVKSEDWIKQNSQYCPGLDVWLNPANEKFLVEPPELRQERTGYYDYIG